MINQSPLRWPDGSVYLGGKKSRFYAISRETGHVLYDGVELDDFHQADSILLVARTGN